MNISIQMAGRTIDIENVPSKILSAFREYISDTQGEISVVVNDRDIAFERQQSEREDRIEGRLPRSFSDDYLAFIAVQRKIAEELFCYDTLLFHGSVVAVDGVGYLFTAKSGTGKSTHTRLWREVFGDRAVMVNDDKPFLKITENGVYACGSPWNGKHGLGTNITVPLKAICILDRGVENEIHPITPQEALLMLFQQSNRPQDPQKMPQYLTLLDKLAAQTSFYHLHCNMTPEAAITAHRGMCGGQR